MIKNLKKALREEIYNFNNETSLDAKIAIVNNNPTFPTDENLHYLCNKWFGLKEGINGCNSLRVATPSNIKSYYAIRHNRIYDTRLNDSASAYVSEIKDTGWSDVRVAEDSFTSQVLLYIVMHHEFLHVRTHYSQLYKFIKKQYSQVIVTIMSEMYIHQCSVFKIRSLGRSYNWITKQMITAERNYTKYLDRALDEHNKGDNKNWLSWLTHG